MTAQWIVCQIGAREHYVLAAELHRLGRLSALCTDAWVRPPNFAARFAVLAGAQGRKLRERYLPELSAARVIAEPLPIILGRQALHRAQGLRAWDRLMAANEAFGETMSAQLVRSGLLEGKPVVFAYSYAARHIFEAAKKAGCTTVLGQIDPGPVEDLLVSEIAKKHGLKVSRARPPDAYWATWKAECDLADRIVVNSVWSRNALIEAGVTTKKIDIIPLAFTAPRNPIEPRSFPMEFTSKRPLRLLFLGQVNVRKGAIELLQAMKRLTAMPVRLSMVGPISDGIKERFCELPNIDWVGPSPRSSTVGYYKQADAFILPTHSDGFALTQLEAASQSLPLIVSRNCGGVVNDNVSGILLKEVSVDAIEAAIRHILDPQVLSRFSSNAHQVLSTFAPERVVEQIVKLAE